MIKKALNSLGNDNIQKIAYLAKLIIHKFN